MATHQQLDSEKVGEASPTQPRDGILDNANNSKAIAGVDRVLDDAPQDVVSPPEADNARTAAYSSFSNGTKMLLVLMTVFATFFSPFSSFIYLPAITPIAEAYHRSIADINLTVTLYQVMQAVAPLVFGDLSDQLGRRPVYMLTFAIYIGANIGLALQNNYAALLVLRALQSTGSSATVAIGSAVMADCTTSAERGGYITAVQASVMFAPALAPVLGGILTQFLGWRSTFWFLTISSGVFLIIYLPFVPESARKVVGDGSVHPPAINMSITTARHLRRLQEADPEAADAHRHEQEAALAKQRTSSGGFRIPVPNVFAAVRIMFEKDVGLLMFFMSLFVMANYAMLVPLQDIIRRRYDFNDLQVGLCYIPFAVGSVVGAVAVGRLLNWNYARVARSIGVSPDRKRGDDMRKFPIERARLDIMWPWTLLAVAMIIAWGWVVGAQNTNLAGPLIILFFGGAGLSGPISILTTLLVDLYPMNPGRVSSTFNLTRAALSAVGTAVVQYIIDAWGYGYTYLFMGLLVLAVSPVVLVVRRWGPKWREQRYQRFEKAAAKKANK
ncbi:hypothetical protein Sste5346_009216 [Sporothrix stenoceras]|uniref:Major facilitator superfamily (MFS) profile domain-containing protein n=1 Tax=Sporothrix stenoceras TaxID=5173 RepID=A0ABR3YNH5_9PEZI